MYNRIIGVTVLSVGVGLLAACNHIHKTDHGITDTAGGIPACSTDPSLEAVACDLDHIEKHIDLYGSITTKHPDIWGAARQTKYQQEIEQIFAAEANADNVNRKVTTFQGARARTDQAFLSSAIALNAALSGKQAALLPPDPILVQTGTRTVFSSNNFESSNKRANSSSFDATRTDNTTIDTKITENGKKTDVVETQKDVLDKIAKLAQSQSASQQGTSKSGNDDNFKTELKTPDVVQIPTDAKIPASFQNDTLVGIKQTPIQTQTLPGFTGTEGLALEPTMILNEKKRFLDHLNQIRRINEGDDTADSPGYALYLMRVPVSVLPGKMTDSGHGAEITMSVKPILGDDLLPSTFRNLVINDMVDQYSELLTSLLNNDRELLKDKKPADEKAPVVKPAGFQQNNDNLTTSMPFPKIEMPPIPPKTEPKDPASKYKFFDPATKLTRPRFKSIINARPKNVSPRPSRHAEYAFPMNHLEELMGEDFLDSLIQNAVTRYKKEIESDQVVHLHDVRSVVREQIVAAYRFLNQAHSIAWNEYCHEDLVRAIRDLNGNATYQQSGQSPFETINSYREKFDKSLGREEDREYTLKSDRLATKALAWAVILESALLNAQLVRDIEETMKNKNQQPSVQGWQDYYAPNPSPSARQSFNEYVACRWPMYTFAVDPVLDQQNIQDTLSSRREMQLALALSFASGNMTANNFTRFARRLEADYQTIDLNRTVVGFSHGDNTFGWRFYPRFQTPEIPSNLQAIGRDLIGGHGLKKDIELHERRLEPGQRECVAMVIMPSFVPYAEMNVSSSWFSLTNPKHKSHSTKETVQLSRRLRSIELCNPKGDQDRYRVGEFSRLQAKAQMLSARLPLQDTKFQVPYENTLGGFEFFNSGITDLTPVLRGWYGASGYDNKQVELFLMGDNFSVTTTQIIAGGARVQADLLSRQVLRVLLPANLAVTQGDKGVYSETGKYIDIRLGTPYGIGGPLRIPVLGNVPKLPERPVLTPLSDKQQIILERETELILEGSNFSADLIVNAGGKECGVTLVSSTIVKVIIPRNVAVTSGKPAFVELKAANAAGLSNAIFIPVADAPAVPPKGMAKLSSNSFDIGFQYDKIGIAGVVSPNDRRPEMKVTLIKDSAKQLVGPITIQFTSKLGDFSINTTVDPIKLTSSDFSEDLKNNVLLYAAKEFGPENVKPVSNLELKAKVITNNKSEIPITDVLTVKWIKIDKDKDTK